MRQTLMVRRIWNSFFFALVILAATAPRASAQGFVSPFIGYNFGGDAGCPEITGCEDKHVNWGVSVGALGSIVGYEAEFAHTNDFFGSSPTQSTSVFTFMNNFMIAPKIGPIQPYGLAGVGLMRTSIESAGQNNDDNQIAWDIGGGLIGYFSKHVGIRGDIRYFHSFEILDLSKFPGIPIQEKKLDFGRFSGALVFKF